MERMTLREAAERTARSITTLRRYIRGGRLRAEKRTGRYGPEYYVCADDLADAGLEIRTEAPPLPMRADDGVSLTLTRLARDTVPISLYHELQMKHEQLLVQYGMVRAGGLRLLELRSEVEARRQELEHREAEMAGLRTKLGGRVEELEKQLREAELELEGQRMENAALREKVRALEMVARNTVTNEAIDEQFARVADQIRRVQTLAPPSTGGRRVPGPWPPFTRLRREPEH